MGSVPEVLVDGLTGFICQTVEECIEALDKIPQIDRRACHDYVLENFTAKRMAEGYEAVYQQLMGDRHAMNGYVHNLSAL
jgi:glycosyltransferase involved in cell wall biosynthesis